MAALDFTFERREKLIRRDSLEEGIAMGISQGISQGMVQMYKKGFSIEQIADIMDKPIQEVTKIVQEQSH